MTAAEAFQCRNIDLLENLLNCGERIESAATLPEVRSIAAQQRQAMFASTR